LEQHKEDMIVMTQTLNRELDLFIEETNEARDQLLKEANGDKLAEKEIKEEASETIYKAWELNADIFSRNVSYLNEKLIAETSYII